MRFENKSVAVTGAELGHGQEDRARLCGRGGHGRGRRPSCGHARARPTRPPSALVGLTKNTALMYAPNHVRANVI